MEFRERMRLLNIFLLGISFMLIFTAFQTMGNVLQTIVSSAQDRNSTGYVPGFSASGYTSQALIYTSFSLLNWFAPSLLVLLGLKCSLVLGGLAYSAFIAQILYLNNILLYGTSIFLGFGAAIIWTAQGSVLSLNSESETIARNSGIFWSLFQSSLLIGNLFVFFVFGDKETIDSSTRNLVTSVLLILALIGSLFFLSLQIRFSESSSPTLNSTRFSALEALKRSFRLFGSKSILILSVNFFYTGLVLTFWSAVYGTSIGNTMTFGSGSKALVGLHGIFVGIGEILGGLLFGIMGKRLTIKGRDPIVMTGFLLHSTAFFLAFLNLPNSSPFGNTTEEAYIVSNTYIALTVSSLLGFGDACFNTQIISLLADHWKSHCTEAFAIFKFIQSTSAALAFVYSNYIGLYYQLLILSVLCLFGTISFCWIELSSVAARRKESLGVVDDGNGPSFHDE